MKNKRVAFTILIQAICWAIISVVSFTNAQKSAWAFQQPDAFLGPIFYGDAEVGKIFDHRFPLWQSEFGDDGNNITMHYNGVEFSDDNGRYGYDQHTGIKVA